MPQWALIQNGVVVAISQSFPNAPTPPPGYSYVEAPSGLVEGSTYSGGTFTPPAPPTYTQAQLLAYAQAKQGRIAAGGISVNVGTSGSPQNVECTTDTASLVLLQGAASIAQSNSGETFSWVPQNGTPVTLSAAQILTIFAAVSAFIQSTFTTLAAVIAAIGASTITTPSQIESFASPTWPANS